MTESIKLYAKDSSDHVWCKQYERSQAGINTKYLPSYSVHTDNTIFSYNLDSSVDEYFESFYLVKIKTSSLSGVSEGDIIIIAKCEYEDLEGNMHNVVYYPCDFGLNRVVCNYQQWKAYFEVKHTFRMWTIFDQSGIAAGSTGTNINFIVDTFFNESWSFQLTTNWHYYGPGEVDYGKVTSITLVYGIPSSGANLNCDASSLINVHCVNGVNKLFQVNLEKTLHDINMIESLDEDLSITVDNLNNVTETVDRMEPIVDSLDSRVSALESETISKYVSR